MIVNIKNYQSYFAHNNKYNGNNELRVLVKKIFQTRDEGKIGYIMSDTNNFKNGRHKNVSEKEISLIENDDSVIKEILKYSGFDVSFPSIIDFNKLGVEEQAIFSYMRYLEYNHIIITGALGSGKTALLKFLIKYINNQKNNRKCAKLNCCNYHLPIAFKIDFNSGYSTKSKSAILRLFQRNLYNKLAKEIIKLLKDKSIFNCLIDGIKNYEEHDYLEEFSYFNDEVINNKKWQKNTNYENSKLILKWIDKRFSKNDFEGKLEAIYNLLNFIIESLEDRNNECFFIIYDNIDRFDDSVQDDLLELIMSSSNNLRIKHLIAIRLTAFGHIAGNGSYSFGVYEHGACPSETIILKRIKHYFSNKSDYIELINKVPNDLLTHFESRLSFILNEFENPNDSLIVKTVKAFSGMSIRRALFLSERLILNSSINYKNPNAPYNLLLRALVVGENKNCKIKKDDGLISNIFYLQSDRSNSLIALKILKLLETIKLNNDYVSLRELYDRLSCLMSFNQEEFFHTINYLIYSKKRLLYINGVSYFRSKTAVVNCHKTVTITQAGIGYLHSLYGTIQYTQDCFSVINWKYKKIHDIQALIKKENINDYLVNRLREVSEKLPNYKIPIDFLLQFVTNFEFSEKKPYIPKVINYRSTNDRFSFVRKGMIIFIIQDICEFLYFSILKVFESGENCNYFQQLPTVQLLVKYSNHTFTTLMEGGFHPELGYWYNLLVICRFWNLLLFEHSSKELNYAIDRYENHLKNVGYLGSKYEIIAANTI